MTEHNTDAVAESTGVQGAQVPPGDEANLPDMEMEPTDAEPVDEEPTAP